MATKEIIEICDSDEDSERKQKRESCIVISDDDDQPLAKCARVSVNASNHFGSTLDGIDSKSALDSILNEVAHGNRESNSVPQDSVVTAVTLPSTSVVTPAIPPRPPRMTYKNGNRSMRKRSGRIKVKKVANVDNCEKNDFESPSRQFSKNVGGHEEDWVSAADYYLSEEAATLPYFNDEKRNLIKFRCNVCSKHFKNNVLATSHLFYHLRPDHKNVTSNIKCLKCLTTFSSFHKLQVHQQWHKNNTLDNPETRNLCQICELEFSDAVSLAYHLKDTHPSQDMPYQCGLCFFRSSLYDHLIKHFNEEHVGTVHVLCHYCLKTFQLHQNPNTGICMLTILLSHLKKHVTSRPPLRCPRCRLFFLTAVDQKRHIETCHQGKRFDKISPSSSAPVSMAAAKVTIDLNRLRLDKECSLSLCRECGDEFGRPNHITRYHICNVSDCVFATCCRRAITRHKNAFHRPPKPNREPVRRGPSDRPQPYYMHCHCSWKTILGNSMATHLCTCKEGVQRPTAKLLEVQQVGPAPESSTIKALMDNVEPAGIEILDSLGLMRVRKSASVATNGIKNEHETNADVEEDPPELENNTPEELRGARKWETVRIAEDVPPSLQAVLLGTTHEYEY